MITTAEFTPVDVKKHLGVPLSAETAQALYLQNLPGAVELLSTLHTPEVAEVLMQDKATMELVVRALICTNVEMPLVFDIDTYRQAMAVWSECQVMPHVITQLLAEDGSWKLDYSQYQKTLVEMMSTIEDPNEFRDVIDSLIELLYGPVQRYLDWTALSGTDGFNGHEYRRHISDIVSIANIFFGKTNLDLSVLERNQFYLAVMCHDIGNGYNRSAHSSISLGVLLMTLGHDALQLPELQPTFRAVLQHDEKMAAPINNALIRKYSSSEADLEDDSPERNRAFLAEYAESVSVVESLIRIFDKSDTGRARTLNTVPPTKGRHERDTHFLINTAFNLNKSVYGPIAEEPSTFLLQLDFNLRPDPDHFTEESPLVYEKQHKSDRVSGAKQYEIELPPIVRSKYKLENVSYFKTLSGELLHSYKERFIIIVLDVLRVLEDVDQVVFKLVDPESGRISTSSGTIIENEPVEVVFHRDTVLEDIAAFKERLGTTPRLISKHS